jgi:NAD(P)-dependent dehydrogenase (short-subunit alcohol dehydrogenase family)
VTGELAGRVVAVTGGASGIGAACVEALAAEGARVYALDLETSGAPWSLHADVTDPASMARAVDHIMNAEGRVDGLVASAGVRGPDVGAEDLDVDAFDAVLGVNLRGVFVSCQAFARPMLAAGSGAIVAIGSMSGNHIINTPMRIAGYHAAKGGVRALVRALATEWGPRGVRVNQLSPGYVATPLSDADPQHHAAWREATVLGRLGTPEEIAAGVRFLLSDGAAFCCGAELLMDGGYVLR